MAGAEEMGVQEDAVDEDWLAAHVHGEGDEAFAHVHPPEFPIGVSLSVSATVMISADVDLALLIESLESVRTARAEQETAKAAVREKFPDLSLPSWVMLVADGYALEAVEMALGRELARLGVSPVEMVDVESSNVARVGWRPLAEGSAHGDMLVEFSGGGLYVYQGVPRDVFEELLSSESKGRFINSVIKPHYGVERIDVDRGDDV